MERTDQPLPDPLVKELRLAGNNDHQHANAYLANLTPEDNQKFAVQPTDPMDSHEPLRSENDLAWIFTKQPNRKLSKDLQFQHDRVIYQVQTEKPAYDPKGWEVTVLEIECGKSKVFLNDTPLTSRGLFDNSSEVH